VDAQAVIAVACRHGDGACEPSEQPVVCGPIGRNFTEKLPNAGRAGSSPKAAMVILGLLSPFYHQFLLVESNLVSFYRLKSPAEGRRGGEMHRFTGG